MLPFLLVAERAASSRGAESGIEMPRSESASVRNAVHRQHGVWLAEAVPSV